ncbi:MAG: hypothetical protein NZ577_03930, partial [Vicinamibacterales bacterium]|nr:hypothetical protein [Vicinamibacterales bacterium]
MRQLVCPGQVFPERLWPGCHGHNGVTPGRFDVGAPTLPGCSNAQCLQFGVVLTWNNGKLTFTLPQTPPYWHGGFIAAVTVSSRYPASGFKVNGSGLAFDERQGRREVVNPDFGPPLNETLKVSVFALVPA